MRKTLLAAILATVAFTPVAAFAQEMSISDNRRGDYNPDDAEQLARRAQEAPRAERAAAPRQEQVSQAAPQRQWQGNRDGGRRDWNNAGNSGGNAGGGSWNRGDRARVQKPQQVAPVQPSLQVAPVQQQQRADRQQRRGYDGNRGGYDTNRAQPNQWNGNGNRGQYDRRAQQPNRDWNSTNRNWNGNRSGDWNSNRSWNDNRGYDRNDRNYARRPDYNRNWRSNNRYDWQRYRSSNRQAFRLPRYYAPYGWDYGYRRFSIGAYLDQILFDRSYWIDSPYSYRLPDVEWPYRWVRYYNDALLVDTETGEVVDVISDIFW